LLKEARRACTTWSLSKPSPMRLATMPSSSGPTTRLEAALLYPAAVVSAGVVVVVAAVAGAAAAAAGAGVAAAGVGVAATAGVAAGVEEVAVTAAAGSSAAATTGAVTGSSCWESKDNKCRLDIGQSIEQGC
jgi:hypothetical protein